MISRNGNGNFVSAHYDWILAGIAAVALLAAAAYYALFSDSVKNEICEAKSGLKSEQTKKATIPEVSIIPYAAVTNLTKVQQNANIIHVKAGSLFASERRVLCGNPSCGRAIVLDAAGSGACLCGYSQAVVKVQKVLDTDGDGLPDIWEERNGLNPRDPADAQADKDGDDFTNIEEFRFKTDPQDRNSHPDYLNYVQLVLPLKATYLPFVFIRATKIPSGWRCEFFDAKQKDDYGRRGRTLSATIGEEIGSSGFILRGYEQKEARRDISGGEGMQKTIDVSEAEIERKRDGKRVKSVIAASKKAKPQSVDLQATLVYTRRKTETLEVVPGAEITLSGAKYKVVEIKATAKGAKVTLEDVIHGKKRTFEALEP